jgi:hypothetical protein
VTKDKAVSISASVLLIGFVCYRLYGWITTGYLPSRFHPAGRLGSFESDPLGFVLAIGCNGFVILAALLIIFMELTEE